MARPDTILNRRGSTTRAENDALRFIDRHPTVQGRCPACGGQSLFLGEGGYVTCSYLSCPDPSAANKMLLRSQDQHLGKQE